MSNLADAVNAAREAREAYKSATNPDDKLIEAVNMAEAIDAIVEAW